MNPFPKFTGRYDHSFDEKGRLTIPSRFRARLGDHFVLTIAPPDPCLAMYPESTWSEFCSKLEAAPRKDAQYRAFVRHLFANTEEVSADAQGRLLIPSVLRDAVGLQREAVLVGALTRVELWPAEAWRATHGAPDGMADLMTELGLY
ncbi:MAG: division/cell wall cluster transcriptional repressor MraZ [Candidatus Eremiobacter antarcticus]|nr:division/cell wall cluster transcriptional repressor MraZ [Candidatus Eremiobacteraeota bacterium]MBC5808343.1 division/cell wall cluster transcriptional repressor MraZ [Candidatus Eremiobacteraeota bacterium]PZR63711.1 MAG: division/cell wall cluster transcriptional repressor MraZ [Candidatus Eremiobacter sp. RRmetagenome_bin22]